MKVDVNLKDEQKEFLDQAIIDYSFKDIETSIQTLVSEILDNQDHENVFVEIRCIGGCISTDEKISVELKDTNIRMIENTNMIPLRISSLDKGSKSTVNSLLLT